ncbi:hypothetical protein VTN77DRAFT_3658 [Rasamsonia byssochlamydoides]|uniref:uncharacterized protein n=1 Tax=Rasamsonia byssochlamydoides TaxID=89139 RepID=UPI003744823A
MGDCGTAADHTIANSSAINPVSPPASEAISVLVTGFGPFKSNAVNASHLIAASLPSSITLPSKGPSAAGDAPREILINAHPEPIPVSYASVRTELPVILEDYARKHNGRRPDLIIHIGIASTRRYYSVETQAHRDNYQITDIHGKLGFEAGEKLWKEQGLPDVLKPGPAKTSDEAGNAASPAVSTQIRPYPPDDHFLKTWKSFAPPETDIRISEDAGRYLCEFIFYSSLARALQEGRDRAAVFFHVPSSTDEESLETGRQVAIALIKAMVTCWIDEAQQSQQPRQST